MRWRPTVSGTGWFGMLASGAVSGTEPAPGQVPEDVRASLSWRVTSWLADPAASPLLVTVAGIAASGWVSGAAVLAGVVAAGHPIAAVATALSASAFVLPALDAATGIVSLAFRAGDASPPARPARPVRTAARRAAGAGRRKPATIRGVVRALHFRSPVPPGSLPVQLRLVLAAALWSTVLTFAWLTVWAVLHGGLAVGDAGASAHGQELAAAAWMVHFIAWCCAACRRLARNRASATISTAVHI